MKVSELFAGKGLEYRKHSNDYRLLLFNLMNGKFRPYLFKVELDSKDSKTKIRDFKDLDLTNIPSSFSGNYSFFSLDGRFVGSWEIQNGERLRAQSYKRPKPGKGKGNENERTSTVEYHCTVTTYTTYVQAGDGEPQIVEQYEVWDCEFTFIPETVAPPSSTDPDNGGTDPGCYEPHPDFEGFMVPCDQKDPCNNFEDLISKVLNTEGGFVDDPVDLGGATNRGVAWHTWQKAAMPVLGKEATLENLKQLTASEATEIYKALYWDSIKLSEIKDGDLRGLIFDFHVHSGPNAVKVLQKLLNELGGNLIVDGIMGEKTIKFLNEYDNIINLYNGFKQKRLEFLKGIVDRSV
jgi:Putative secretion activating protein